MFELAMLGIGVAFFVAAAIYIRACEEL